MFLRFCLCIFENDTVKSDCPVQIFLENDEIFKDYLNSFTVFLEILKKKRTKSSEKKSSENELTGHFQSFFIYFFRPPDPRSEKQIPVNQLIKNIWPNHCVSPSVHPICYPHAVKPV